MPEGMAPHLGDIVISFPAAVDNARRFGKKVDDQICFFVEHGLMHLLGYHHAE
jgi:probable rRNA maturation factor